MTAPHSAIINAFIIFNFISLAQLKNKEENQQPYSIHDARQRKLYASPSPTRRCFSLCSQRSLSYLTCGNIKLHQSSMQVAKPRLKECKRGLVRVHAHTRLFLSLALFAPPTSGVRQGGRVRGLHHATGFATCTSVAHEDPSELHRVSQTETDTYTRPHTTPFAACQHPRRDMQRRG